MNFRAWLGLKTMSFHQVVAMVCTHSNSPTEVEVVLILLVFFKKLLDDLSSSATYMYELRSWMQVESTPTTQPTLAGKGCKMGQASILSHGVTRWGLAISTLKKYLKAKEELWKLKYFTMQK